MSLLVGLLLVLCVAGAVFVVARGRAAALQTAGPGRRRLNSLPGYHGSYAFLWAIVPALVFLAACGASPAPEFMGATRTDVNLNGRDYTVFQKGERVEVIRLGYARRGEHQEIRATMIELIPRVTGCKLRDSTLEGDSGEMRGSLDCPKQP